jgi:hypothetical protein
MTTLDVVTPRNRPEPSAEDLGSRELVRLGRRDTVADRAWVNRPILLNRRRAPLNQATATNDGDARHQRSDQRDRRRMGAKERLRMLLKETEPSKNR